MNSQQKQRMFSKLAFMSPLPLAGLWKGSDYFLIQCNMIMKLLIFKEKCANTGRFSVELSLFITLVEVKDNEFYFIIFRKNDDFNQIGDNMCN